MPNLILLSEYRVTGWYVPEHGGATYPVLICPRCKQDILNADKRDTEVADGWRNTMALDELIAAAQKHRDAHA